MARSGKARALVARGRTPDDVQRLAYEAAVVELRGEGIEWGDADAAHLRAILGRTEIPELREARRLLDDLATVLRDAIPAMQALVDFADRHPDLAASTSGAARVAVGLGGIDGPVRKLWYLAEQRQRRTRHRASVAEHDWRGTLAEFASKEIGWWSRNPRDARTLALLSILAGIPDWKSMAARLRRSAKGISGRDAIAEERRAMRHHLGQQQ